MEVAIIDWKSIDSRFVKDDLYEHINAPQWIDFSSPDHHSLVDDEAWFCRPDCNHPKTVEDFMKKSPTSKLLLRAATISEILPFGDRNRRDATLKKRGLTQPSMPLNKDSKYDKFIEDTENQNPNLSTPPNQKASRFMKETIKSSTEKKHTNNSSQKEETTPMLKSTLSARNLFAGRDILNQITDFCNELKRLAMRTKERENGEREGAKKNPVAVGVNKEELEEFPGCDSRGLDEREKERKPLLEVSKEKCDAVEKSIVKEKLRRKKRTDDAENIPISVDLKTIRRKEQESLLQIRTNPPSPQCFSANPPAKAAPKAFRSRPQERGIILQEVEQSNKEVRKEEKKGNQEQQVSSAAAEKEGKTLDVFWFLKPCTLSG